MDVSGGIVISANGTITMVEQENCVVSEGGHGSFMDGRDRNSLDGKLAVSSCKLAISITKTKSAMMK